MADDPEPTVKTEWGVRYDKELGKVGVYGTSSDDERHARMDAEPGALVRRTVTYGPWEDVRPRPGNGGRR